MVKHVPVAILVVAAGALALFFIWGKTVREKPAPKRTVSADAEPTRKQERPQEIVAPAPAVPVVPPPVAPAPSVAPRDVVAELLASDDPEALGVLADEIARGAVTLTPRDIDRLIALVRGAGKEHHKLIAIEILATRSDPGGLILAALMEAGRLEEQILSHHAIELMPRYLKSNRQAQGDVSRFLVGLATGSGDVDTRLVAIDAVDFASLADPEVQGFTRLLSDSEEDIRATAVARLGEPGPRREEAVRLLSAHFRSEKTVAVKREVINAIVQIAGPETVALLESFKGQGAELDRQIEAALKELR